MPDENALTLPQAGFLAPPRTLDEAMDLADMIAKSSIVPKDLRGKPGDVLIAIQLGMELGLPWMTACQSIAVINGRPSIWGDALKGIVMASPLCEYIEEDSLDVVTAKGRGRCKTKRKGKPEVEVIFTIDDAKRAKLWGREGPWTNYPARMLMMRSRSFCLRDAYPDLLRGIVAREEAEDIAPAIELPPAEAPRRSRKHRQIDAAASSPTAPPNSESSSKAPDSSESGPTTSPQSEQATPSSSSPTPATSKPAEASDHPDDYPVFAKIVSRNEKTSKAGSVYVVLTLRDEDGKEGLYTSYEKDVVEKSKPLHLSGEVGQFICYKQQDWLKVRSIRDAAEAPAPKPEESEPPA